MEGIKMINIIIADDQEILRESLKSLIMLEPEFEVVSLAQNGLEAFELCNKYKPDVVLMDVLMPSYSGLEGIKLIKEKFSDIKVLMLTSFEDQEYISKSLEYGADGYILKDINPEMLKLAIKCVYAGVPVIHKNALAVLTKSVSTTDTNDSKPENIKPNITFTSKELEIIRLIAKGKSNTDIAKEIFLSKGRIANIITRIFEKTHLNDRTELAVYAIKNNIV